jgi:hypothetical protein
MLDPRTLWHLCRRGLPHPVSDVTPTDLFHSFSQAKYLLLIHHFFFFLKYLTLLIIYTPPSISPSLSLSLNLFSGFFQRVHWKSNAYFCFHQRPVDRFRTFVRRRREKLCLCVRCQFPMAAHKGREFIINLLWSVPFRSWSRVIRIQLIFTCKK